MQLVHESTGIPVNAGEVVHDFRGKAAIVLSWSLPTHEGSTGRVLIKEMNESGFTAEYYPSVYSLRWASA